VTEHKVGTRQEWLAARIELLEREKELTRRSDELARERRELPWVPVEEPYSFETDEGTKTLAELFEGRSQLLVFHLMFGPDDGEACPGCSFMADHVDGAVVHLNHRDVTFVAVSRAPLEEAERLQAPQSRPQRPGGGVARSECLRARGRGRVPQLLLLRPRYGRAARHLAVAGPGAEGTRRRLRELAAPPRRVRVG